MSRIDVQGSDDIQEGPNSNWSNEKHNYTHERGPMTSMLTHIIIESKIMLYFMIYGRLNSQKYMLASDNVFDIEIIHKTCLEQMCHNFFEIKFKNYASFKITAKDLFPQAKHGGSFALKKYFDLFCETRKKYENVCLFIMTNAVFVLNDDRIILEEVPLDKIPFGLNHLNGSNKAYKIKFVQEDFKQLLLVFNFEHLVDVLAAIFLDKKHDKVFDSKTYSKLFEYGTAFEEQVFQMKDNLITIHSDFVEGLSTVSREALHLRNALIKKMGLTEEKFKSEFKHKNIQLNPAFHNEVVSKIERDESTKRILQRGLNSGYLEDFFNQTVWITDLSEDHIDREIMKSVPKVLPEEPLYHVDKLLTSIMDWRRKPFGTYISTNHFYEQMKSFSLIPAVSSIENISPGRFVKKLQQYKILFEETSISSIRQYLLNIREGPVIYNFVNTSPKLGALKVYQALENCESYMNKNNYIFIDFEMFCEYKYVLKRDNCLNLLIITFDCIGDCGFYSGDLIDIFLNFQKVVLITPNESLYDIIKNKDETLLTLVRDANRFCDLSAETRQNVLDKKVNFQGNRLCVKDILECERWEDLPQRKQILFNNIFSGNKLETLLLVNEIELGECFEENEDINEFYIPRNLNHKELSIQKLNSIKCDHLFIFIDCGENDLKKIIGTKEKIVFYDRDNNDVDGTFYIVSHISDADDLSSKLTSRFPQCDIHLLRISKNNKIIWNKSYKGCLEKHLNTVSYEETIPLENLTKEKVIVIMGAAGMGKSSTLTNLCKTNKALNPNMWVVKLDFKNCLLNTDDKLVDDETKALLHLQNILREQFKSKKKLSQHFFNFSLSTGGKILLALDNFDRIEPKHINFTLKWILALSRSNINSIVITSRTNVNTNIQNHYYPFIFSLENISQADQKDLFMKYWKQKTNCGIENISKFSESVLEEVGKLVKDKMNEFTGIPLHLKMLLEIVENSEENFRNDEESVGLINLFQKFVHKKFLIYWTQKIDSDFSHVDEQRNIFIRKHEGLALQSLCPQILRATNENNFNTMRDNSEITKEGLIGEIINGTPYFIHKRFAEYFVANYLFNLEPIDRNENFSYRDILQDEKFSGVRIFLNAFLIESPERCNNFCEVIGEIFSEEEPKYNSLRMALLERNNKLCHLLIKSEKFSKFINQHRSLCQREENNLNWKKITYIVENITNDLSGLQETYENNYSDNILEIENAMGYTNNVYGSTHDCETNDSLNEPSAILKLMMTWKIIENVNELGDGGVSIIHCAASAGKRNVIELLLRHVDVDIKDLHGWTVVHYACMKNNLDLLKWLCAPVGNGGAGANLNTTTNDGDTVLHVAVFWNSLDVVKWLMEQEKNGQKGYICSVKNDDEKTPLAIALEEPTETSIINMLKEVTN